MSNTTRHDSRPETLARNTYVINPDGEDCWRVCLKEGEVTLTGGSVGAATDGQTGMRVTTLDVTDTATALPAAALSDRNSLTIFNLSTTDTLYVGGAAVVAVDPGGTTTVFGYQILTESEWNADLDEGVSLFGIAEAGKTVRVQVVEFAKA